MKHKHLRGKHYKDRKETEKEVRENINKNAPN